MVQKETSHMFLAPFLHLIMQWVLITVLFKGVILYYIQTSYPWTWQKWFSLLSGAFELNLIVYLNVIFILGIWCTSGNLNSTFGMCIWMCLGQSWIARKIRLNMCRSNAKSKPCFSEMSWNLMYSPSRKSTVMGRVHLTRHQINSFSSSILNLFSALLLRSFSNWVCFDSRLVMD